MKTIFCVLTILMGIFCFWIGTLANLATWGERNSKLEQGHVVFVIQQLPISVD